MKDVNYIEKVRRFNERFKIPIMKNQAIPSEKRCKLRVELISEELKELVLAIKKDDLVEVADALCDIQYTLSGAVLEFGLQDKFVELFDEVQRSNMSKACTSMEEVEATQSKYLNEKGWETYFQILKDGSMGVYRRDDDKLLKSINYSPAELMPILEK